MALRPNQQTAALLLGRGMKRQEVARKVGVHLSCIYKWFERTPEFGAAVEAEKAYMEDASDYGFHVRARVVKGRIDELLLVAIDALEKQLKEGSNEGAIVKAASYVLDKYSNQHIQSKAITETDREEEQLLSALKLVK
jgi:transposase-like protein